MSKKGFVRTGDQALVREINLSVIMNQLRQHAPISRATLAENTGLNKTTVSSLVTELIEQQFVHEVGMNATGLGRPSVLLELNPSAGFIISAEIGVDFISCLSADFTAEILWQHKETTQPEAGQQAILDRFLALLDQAFDSGRACCEERLLGVAVGAPGLVDYQTGTLLFAPNLRWQDVPLRDIVSQKFDVPIFVDNEANMAALAEYYTGAAQGFEEVLYISSGVGLGGAIVQQGQLYRGTTGLAGEFGHMTVDSNGAVCNCGNQGCWETLVSQSTLSRYVLEGRKAASGDGRLRGDNDAHDPISVEVIVKAARSNDRIALDALRRVGRDLGIGIALLVNALNPDLVVFGGILSLASDFLLPIVETELEQRALRWTRAATKVVRANYGSDACVMGGIAAVHQMMFSQPTRMLSAAA